MAVAPLFPEMMAKRPESQAMRAYRHKIHPFLSPSFQAVIRSQLSITDWLLIGCGLQALIVFVSPLSVSYSLAPTLALIVFKILKTLATIFGVIGNPHMKNIRVGRQTAIFPNSDGGFERKEGESVGGKGMCIVLLSSKCNQSVFLPSPYDDRNHANIIALLG